MSEVTDQAARAAAHICGEVASVRHVETLPTGEQVCVAGIVGHEREATVTLNPNGTSAGVEWRDRYRVFKVCGAVERNLP